MRVMGNGTYQSTCRASNAYTSANLRMEGIAEAGTVTQSKTAVADTVELSQAFQRASLRPETGTSDYSQQIRTLLEALRVRYPGVQILTGVHADESNLKALAAGLGAGPHLVITDEFLERMGSSGEDFQACRDVLTEMTEQLSAKEKWIRGRGVLLEKDRAVSWLVPNPQNDLVKLLEEKQRRTREAEELLKKKQIKEETRIKVHPSSYNTAASYARLARAGNRSAVQQVMSEARRSIGSLRMVTCYGDEKERVKAGKAIRSMQKLLLRGRRKMSRIQEESLLEIRKKHAKERQEEERVRQMKLELEKKRTKRFSADGAIALEGRLDGSALEWYKRCHPDKEGELAAGTGDIPDGGFGSGGADLAGGIAGTAGNDGFTADQVIISSMAAF